MQIVATFNNYEEMMEFAENLRRTEKVDPESEKDMPESQTPEPRIVQKQPAQTGDVQPVSTTSVSYSLDDLSRAAMVLMDKGLQSQLQQLLSTYGVASLPELPKEQYGNFATALRGMGAQI